MPDIAELRTKFTADDSDFQAAYRRISLALNTFQNGGVGSTSTLQGSARAAGVLNASISTLAITYQKLSSVQGLSLRQSNLEVDAMLAVNSSTQVAITLSQQLTSAREKQAIATKQLADAEVAASKGIEMLGGKGSSKDEKGTLGKLRETFHEIAELADDIDKTKKGYDAIGEIVGKLKASLGSGEVIGVASEVGESASAATAGMAGLVAEAGPYLLAVAAAGVAVYGLKKGWDALVQSGIQTQQDFDEQAKQLRALRSEKANDLKQTIDLINQAKQLQTEMSGNSEKTNEFRETLTKIGALHPDAIIFDKLGNAIGLAATNQQLLNHYTQQYLDITSKQRIDSPVQLYGPQLETLNRQKGILMEQLRGLQTNGLLTYLHGGPNSDSFKQWATQQAIKTKKFDPESGHDLDPDWRREFDAANENYVKSGSAFDQAVSKVQSQIDDLNARLKSTGRKLSCDKRRER
ncbi:MAG TPA: hypothetical protein VGL56_14815 [Fimbriimonadaceae bacterium]|jgi:hypothetical protein